MGHNYIAVQWNRQKKLYDRILWLGILVIALSFVLSELLFHPTITPETLIIRTSALVAIILLHIILSIGPLSRLNPFFLPLLYNRRHLGVSMFLFALIHGIFSIIQFHSLGDTNAIISVFTSNQRYQEISAFPFQILGFLALVILFIMAATSHDFWLKNLTPKIWKALHMGVYFAYALIIAHVALGALQYEDSPLYWGILVGGFLLIASLHLISGIKTRKSLNADKKRLEEAGFYDIGPVSEIPEHCAKTLFLNGENIAVFKYEGKVSAVNNICRHQMGPLGEGKIVDGCITCPWHGYQYLPENGQAPPPFTEKLETYEVKILKDQVWVNPQPHPEGTYLEPAKINA